MADLSNNASFIPKRGATKRSKKTRNGSLYILTIISYVLLFTTLLAALGVFLYGRHISSQLQQEVSILNTEVSGFKEADMQRVQELDTRLRQANERLNNSVSVISIFDAIEAATIDTVRLSNLELERVSDEGYDLQASVETDTFDSSIFQRGVFERNQIIKGVDVSEVTILDTTGDNGEVLQSVTFSAALQVPLSSIPYTPKNTAVTNPIIFEEAPVNATSSEAVDEIFETTEVNNETL